jgi:hypothetical protein
MASYIRAKDRFSGSAAARSDAGRPFPITPSDTVQPDYYPRAIRVGTGAGDISLRMEDGSTVVIPDVQVYETVQTSGAVLVMATGTAATGLTGYA